MSDSTPAPDILYHDQWLIAIDKPAGLLVHRSPIDHHETRNAMQWLRDRIGQWVYPLHRLDKATSGLLLFALDTDTARQMGACFEAHRVHKRYLAVVRGFAPETTLDHPLRDIAAFKSERCEQPVERAAITHFRLLQRFELPHPDGRFPSSRYSLVEACPKTGRKHQIRRHLKHLSHPIIGDVRYGKGPHNRLFREHFDSLRLLLAATDIEFVHPVTGQLISIHCPPDASFAQMLQKLEPWIVSR